MCDQISDAILDAHLKQDPNAKVACGTSFAPRLRINANRLHPTLPFRNCLQDRNDLVVRRNHIESECGLPKSRPWHHQAHRLWRFLQRWVSSHDLSLNLRDLLALCGALDNLPRNEHFSCKFLNNLTNKWCRIWPSHIKPACRNRTTIARHCKRSPHEPRRRGCRSWGPGRHKRQFSSKKSLAKVFVTSFDEQSSNHTAHCGITNVITHTLIWTFVFISAASPSA